MTNADEEIYRLRVPPHSEQAEQSVLGGLLLDNSAWDRCGDLLHDSDFYRHEHKLIYAAIGGLINAAKPADVITVFECLQSLGKAADAGGLEYLGRLSNCEPSARNIRRHAEIVRERAVLRKLVAVGDEIATMAFNPQGKSAAQVMDDAQGLIIQVADAGTHGLDDWESSEVGVIQLLDRLGDTDRPAENIPTSLELLDAHTDGGPLPGDLVSIVMRSGMGKTALALNILDNAARLGKPGCVFSLEMAKPKLHGRRLAAAARVHLTKIKRPERLSDEEWSRLSAAGEKLARLPVHIVDRSGLNINEIRTRARRLHRRVGGLKVIVVDHLTLTRALDTKALYTKQLAEVTAGLKGLAKELGCVVYLLVQINRTVDQRDDKMPTLGDIRDTACVEDDSDIIITGHWEFKKNPELEGDWKHYMQMAILKQRDGALPRFPLYWTPEHMLFEDWPADLPVPKVRVKIQKGADL